jgi:hypothetical protein
MIPRSDKTVATKTVVQKSKPILYPEFREAADYVEDAFWKNALIAASHGEFSSRSTTYIDGRLSRKDITSGKKMPTDPDAIAKAFIRFHKKHERILSNNDLEKQEIKRNEICNKQVVLTWSTCSLQMKKACLNQYAKTKCKEMGFQSKAELYLCRTDLSSLLMLCLSLKMLTDKTVHMENNVITNILCVKYDERKKTWMFR